MPETEFTEPTALEISPAVESQIRERVKRELEREQILATIMNDLDVDRLDQLVAAVDGVLEDRRALRAEVCDLTKDWALVDGATHALKWNRMDAENKPRGTVLVWFSASQNEPVESAIVRFVYGTDAFGIEYLERVEGFHHTFMIEPKHIHVWAEIPKPGPDSGVTSYGTNPPKAY